MDLQAIVDETLGRLEMPSTAARSFQATNAPRFAIGRNTDTLNIHRTWPLAGVIDDFHTEQDWHGIPVVKMTDVPTAAWVVNCSTSISPVCVLDHLAKAGLGNVIGLHELAAYPSSPLPWPDFVRAQRQEILAHPDAWAAIHASLHDDVSRRTFLDVLRYRLTADPAYMKSYRVRIQEQYFEDFMRYRDETFVDAGGFDGDTAQAFADRYPDYRKIILFEPSVHNMQAARRRLAGYRGIEYRTVGLSDSAGILPFDQDGGSASSVTDGGSSAINVDTLDAVVAEPVTVIKMDLEGWELKALHGSSRHIADDRPKLAIAVYHSAADFRLVHEYIGHFRHNYKCHIRHYTQGWSETIMFFST